MAWRKLRHNKSTQIARTLIFVDCETRSIEGTADNTGLNKLWFGVARSGRFINERGRTIFGRNDFCRFDSADEFWHFAESKASARHTTWIYAHNAGFDFVILGLISRVDDGRLKLSKPRKHRNKETKQETVSGLLMLDDPPTVIGLEDTEGRRYVVCDTLNYWRVSLDSLGKSVGLNKLDYPAPTASDHKWTRYCHRDVEVIETAVTELIQWWREMDLGNWRWTGPGLAMSAFRHRFLKHDIVFHDIMPIRALERAGYFGGQLEAYRLGTIDEPVYQYDVVSLYPAVMRDKPYPIRLLEWDHEQEFDTDLSIPDPLSHVATVRLNSPHDTFPVRHDNEVFYCRGQCECTLCGPELAYAMSCGYVKSIGARARYAMGPIFGEYVDFFYELKDRYEREGNQTKRNFVKLLLNSLYGKFGQKGGRWQYNPNRMPLGTLGIFWEHNPFNKTVQKCLGLGNLVFDWLPGAEIERASPAISAWVTSYARQYMRKLKQTAGHENVYYQSTDSLIVNATGKERLERPGNLIGSSLGQLKLEHAADSAWIGGLHWYRIGAKTVEGSKKKSAETINDLQWSELQFDSLLSVVERAGSAPDSADGINIRRVQKSRNCDYRKGTVQSDGRIIPFDGQVFARPGR